MRGVLWFWVEEVSLLAMKGVLWFWVEEVPCWL